ncbi:hypothetical protein HDG32_005347 [Paraburkholderia sp. CI2]|nr:hypothetical protein [Paraburkholderia sp. CI2]
MNKGMHMSFSQQQTLTPSALARQLIEPHFRAWMDHMIGLVQKWTCVVIVQRVGVAV